jgi:hypothetical protein
MNTLRIRRHRILGGKIAHASRRPPVSLPRMLVRTATRREAHQLRSRPFRHCPENCRGGCCPLTPYHPARPRSLGHRGPTSATRPASSPSAQHLPPSRVSALPAVRGGRCSEGGSHGRMKTSHLHPPAASPTPVSGEMASGFGSFHPPSHPREYHAPCSQVTCDPQQTPRPLVSGLPPRCTVHRILHHKSWLPPASGGTYLVCAACHCYTSTVV